MQSVSATPLLWPPEEACFPHVVIPPGREEWGMAVRSFLLQHGPPWDRTVTFATSGSSGGPPKGVVFFPDALEASARGVNLWLGADRGGDWCCPLPAYHVGGFMIHVRAALAGSRVFSFNGRWEPEAFADFLSSSGAAWCSLVPAQVVDIVKKGIMAPANIQSIVVGGGALLPEMGERARGLGWPVVQSYGMTETASQIATALPGEPYSGRDLPILPHWEIKTGPEGRLQVKGPGRFAAYVHFGKEGNGLELFPCEPGEWWTARDIVSVADDKLTFIRRADRVVKILGELVDADAVESRFAEILPGALICPLPDTRRGIRLCACYPDEERLLDSIGQWNSQEPGLYKIDYLCAVEIPRNAMGKIDRKSLEQTCLAAAVKIS